MTLKQFKKLLQPSVHYTVDVTNYEVTYTKICSVTNEPYIVTISKFEYIRLKNLEFIQDVLPHRSADEREFIISGVTPAEWDQMFPQI